MYSVGMESSETVGARDARKELGRLVDQAHFQKQHIVITKNDEPRAVLVPYSWWKEHADSDE